MTLPELIEHASVHPLTRAQVEPFCLRVGISMSAFCDRVAREVAHGYAERRLTYAYCDNVMDHLFRCLTAEYHEPPPDYAFAVFEAFEEGEYHHPTDPLTASSEDLYTRPLIAKILAGEQPPST